MGGGEEEEESCGVCVLNVCVSFSAQTATLSYMLQVLCPLPKSGIPFKAVLPTEPGGQGTWPLPPAIFRI